MIVEYTYNGKSALYNLPAQRPDQDLTSLVDAYAPRDHWEGPLDVSHIQIGQTGTNDLVQQAITLSTSTGVISDAQEVYIRSLIYQVLDEINNNTV
jgi:hypothetical protein